MRLAQGKPLLTTALPEQSDVQLTLSAWGGRGPLAWVLIMGPAVPAVHGRLQHLCAQSGAESLLGHQQSSVLAIERMYF